MQIECLNQRLPFQAFCRLLQYSLNADRIGFCKKSIQCILGIKGSISVLRIHIDQFSARGGDPFTSKEKISGSIWGIEPHSIREIKLNTQSITILLFWLSTQVIR